METIQMKQTRNNSMAMHDEHKKANEKRMNIKH